MLLFKGAPVFVFSLDIISWLLVQTLWLPPWIFHPSSEDSSAFWHSLLSLPLQTSGSLIQTCSELQTLDRNVQAPVCRHPLRVSSSDSVVTIISQSCKFLHIYISCVLSVSLVQHWLIHIHISMIISP